MPSDNGGKMLNLIQKIHAIMVSNEIIIWHYPQKTNEQFYYWLASEPGKEGYGFYSFTAMIEAAYEKIDPLKKKLPEKMTEPELFDIGPIS